MTAPLVITVSSNGLDESDYKCHIGQQAKLHCTAEAKWKITVRKENSNEAAAVNNYDAGARDTPVDISLDDLKVGTYIITLTGTAPPAGQLGNKGEPNAKSGTIEVSGNDG